MSDWIVTWWDGIGLRCVVVYADATTVVNVAMGHGVIAFNITKIEKVAK